MISIDTTEKDMVQNIAKRLILHKIPEYKINYNNTLISGLFLAFSILLCIVFSYLSYHFLFNTFLIASVILAIATFYFHREFHLSQLKYDMIYFNFQDTIQDIVIIDHADKNLSESMIFWFFINKEHIDGEIYAPILLDSMKYDINHKDCYGNTLLHYIIKNDELYNQNKIYISHALLIGADLDIENDKSITPRSLLSQKYPEYLSTIEQLEIIKSFKE